MTEKAQRAEARLARLAGRRIVVTGAASGIGRRTAQLFVAEGARVGLLDLNGEGVARAAREIDSCGYSVDITDEAAVETVVGRAADDLGGIDGLVNATGRPE
jgi:NAD(P)-dependent dehydrogenase (short-subunit alcohol dehydrogenase family)